MNSLLKQNIKFVKNNSLFKFNLFNFKKLNINCIQTNQNTQTNESTQTNQKLYQIVSSKFSTKKATTFKNLKPTIEKLDKVKQTINTNLKDNFIDKTKKVKKEVPVSLEAKIAEIPVTSSIFLAAVINTPFYFMASYLGLSYFLSLNTGNLMNSTFFAFKALSLNHAMWGGLHLGFSSAKLEDKLNKGEVYKNFDIKFYKSFLPGLTTLGLTQYMLLTTTTPLSISICFVTLAGVEYFIYNMDKSAVREGIAPSWFGRLKDTLKVFTAFFFVVFYIYILKNNEDFNERKLQIKSVEKIKNMFELEDEEYTKQMLESRNLINEAELNIGWNTYEAG